jgi:nuclear pore complex protein Nup133
MPADKSLASFTASALSSAGLALALTRDHALVWDYSTPASPSKVVTLPLPFGLRSSDPLPLGAIVRNGPTNDFGVVAIAPSSGKITFWDNIDSAEARGLYPQRHQGVDGSVKMYSGEVITELVDIEHAGYILNFSSGRLAQLTLRDSQGRPSVTATVLNSPSASSGSFFSFKGLLGGAIRKTISAVKARPSESKGQMEVITTTRNGVFQTWDLSWSGQQIFKNEIDASDAMLSAIQAEIAPEIRGQHELRVLDFAIMDSQNNNGSVSLLVLVALFGRNMLDYTLLEVDLSGAGSTVTRAIPVRNFCQHELPVEPTGTLLLPRPGHTAFVHFPGAMFIASLAQPEESPEAQLLSDAGRDNVPFQDAVYFRGDIPVVISGFALETSNRKDKQAAALFFVQNYGIVQISAPPPTTDDEDKERSRVTARSKLEQATFFSTIPGTILDFSIKSRFSFSEEETSQAAMDVSQGIVSSSYESLEKVTSSMDDHFGERAFALRNLISHLRADYSPLPFETKWGLLWRAEKLAAAHALWNWYEVKLQDQKAHPEAYPENILMGDIIKALNERYKTTLQAEIGEKDSIRHFFLRDADYINTLIPWGWFYLRTFYMKEGAKERPAIMQRLSEGSDVMLVALETAFSFRQTNIELYGLDADSLEDGLLKPGLGYDLLPQFWTSSHNIVSSIRSLVDVGRNLAVENYEEGFQETLSQKIGKDNPRLVKIGCQAHIERFQWALEQSDQKQREMGRSLREEWNINVRPNHIYGLMEIGLATDGMNLAEQYRDMPTLVNLIWDESKWLESEKADARSKMEQAESTVKLNKIKERINRYFEAYGDEWAEAFYLKHIKENQSGQIFMKEHLNQPALTRFLRADPSRARLGWINEVCGEKNYEAAAEALFESATKQETNAWCQQVELSMAKLAMLCSKEVKPDEEQQSMNGQAKEQTRAEKLRENLLRTTTQQLEYSKIQELLYERLLPTITGALDDDSALELLMAEFGQGRLKERPAHQTILKEGFEALIHHRVIDPALMVDVLTLMEDNGDQETSLMVSNEFTFALKVLVLNWSTIHRTTRDGLLKLVWKRLCLKDNWAEINQTKDVSDAALNDLLASTAVGWTFRNLLGMMGKVAELTCCSIKTDWCVEAEPSSDVAWPKQAQTLVGAGGTHGELCVRFASEDLREPIIKDNLLDDEVLQEQLEKNKLDEWFKRALKAGKRAYDAEKAQQEVAGDAEGESLEIGDDVAEGETGEAADVAMEGS